MLHVDVLMPVSCISRGFRGFYQGYPLTLARNGLSTVFTMTTYGPVSQILSDVMVKAQGNRCDDAPIQ